MDKDLRHEQGDALQGRRVLAVLPLGRKDRTQSIVSALHAGKKRWSWQIDVLCNDLDRRPFESLAAPSGRFFARSPALLPEDWERDSATVAVVEQRMREAERVAGVPTGRIILAGAHSVGRAFNVPVRHPPRYAIVRRVLRDPTEPFRIVRRYFGFAEDVLEASKPDFICAYEFATPLNFTVWLAAQRRGIPCVAMRYSKMNSDQAFWTCDRIMLNALAIERGAARRKAKGPVSDAARARIATFRDTPAVVNYIASRWQNRVGRHFFKWHYQYLRSTWKELLKTFSEKDKSLREPPFNQLFRYYRALFLSHYQQRFFHTLDDEQLARMKYVYFPLHKEAELAQTFQATLWHDQRNTVRVLASMLPAGYRLVIREHKLNEGQHPSRFFRELSKLPNVIVIDPFDSQFKYISHADLIVTENGSSGWEGLLLGRRVLALSRTFYDGADLATKVVDPDELNAAILKTLAAPSVADAAEHDYALGCVIDAELETTFPLVDEGVPRALELLEKTLAASLPPRGLGHHET